jgi:hypothetical protein
MPVIFVGVTRPRSAARNTPIDSVHARSTKSRPNLMFPVSHSDNDCLNSARFDTSGV